MITVYTYGAKLPADDAYAFQILRKANRYRNKLVELKKLYGVCMELSKEPEFSDDINKTLIDLEYKAEQREARKHCGLHCGTYNMIANGDARKAKSFRRFDGSGRIGAPINANQSMMPVAGVFTENPTLCLLPQGEAPDHIGNDGRPLPKAKRLQRYEVRLGQGRNADPIVAVVRMHRPLPQGGIIKMAWLQRRRIATHFKWELQLVVEHVAEIPSRPVPGRSVGLDLGWRSRVDTKRVAMLSNGRELTLEPKHFARMAHVNSLQSIADRAFNAVKPHHAMKNRDKLARRVRWGEFPQLETWRQQNRHLTDWHGFARRNTLLARREKYRHMARALCEEFDTIYIEKFNLSAVAKKKKKGESEDKNGKDRPGRVLTSPSEFRNALRMMATKSGVRLIEVPCAYTTRVCNVCKHINKANSKLVITCEQCGDKQDQDLRAAVNIGLLGKWIDTNPDRSQEEVKVLEILGAVA